MKRCEVLLCQQERFTHPEKGELCVCEEHWLEIEAGIRRVPPLRKNIDYVSTSHKPFLVYELPDNLKID
jgi:hypothetical protein